MAKPNRTLLILGYIWENSDEDHPVTAKDIIAYLAEHDIYATAKTVKADVEQLQEFGVDIEIVHSTQNRYFMYERVFELAEVKLLIDAAQSARFITENKSKTLIKKISSFASVYQQEKLKRELYVDKRFRVQSNGGYYSVEPIHTAIQQRKKVTFKYLEYMPDKSIREKHDGQMYVFSPYALIWNDDCYYVIGYSEAPNHNKVVKFRVDRMKDLTMSDCDAVRKPKDFDVEDYFSQVFSMYDGPECCVSILCENSVMKSVIDRFGEKVSTVQVGKTHFLVTATVCLSPTFYSWIFSFGGKMRIKSPADAIEGFQNMLKNFNFQEKS